MGNLERHGSDLPFSSSKEIKILCIHRDVKRVGSAQSQPVKIRTRHEPPSNWHVSAHIGLRGRCRSTPRNKPVESEAV